MKKPDSVIVVPGSIDTFFLEWFRFLKPFHDLTDREMEVAAEFVKLRYELGKAINNDDVLDSVVMNEDSRRKVREACNITASHFQVVLGKLRKNGVIVDGKLNHKYVPRIEEGSDTFSMMMLFKL